MTAATGIPRRHGDRGAVSIAVLLGIGLGALLVVPLVNLSVFQWGEGVVRAALDEGARVGARNGDVTVCEARATSTIHDMAAGMADGVTVDCVVEGRSMTATATIAWDGWITSLTDRHTTLEASAALEDR